MIHETGDSHKDNDCSVVILLAAYNGARYIADQIRSIQSQTFTNWRLVIRDDGSTDDTVGIINEFSYSDDRIEVLSNAYHGEKSAKENFNCLMKFSSEINASYIFFSDQDDIWMRDKMDKLMKFMRQLEQAVGKVPICVHTDMEVVDDSGHLLHRSFMQYQGIRHIHKHQLRVLVNQNFVTGCTMLINRRLLDASYPVPEQAVIHDWWIAQISSALGVLAYINEPLVKYRQHDANVIGAKKFYDAVNPLKNNFWDQLDRIKRNIDGATCQSAYFLKRIMRYADTYSVSKEAEKIAEVYSSMNSYNRYKRVYFLLRYGIRRISKIEWSLMIMGMFFHRFS